jgi:hypothetical protein
MNKRILAAILLSVLCLTGSGSSSAAAQTAVGIRAGGWTSNNPKDFEQYEIFAEHDMPWKWQWSSNRSIDTRLGASVGTLYAAGNSATLITLGPSAVMHTDMSPISLEAGIELGWLTERRFGKDNLGCSFQFVSHLGIDLLLSSHWETGYRFEHISNGSIDTQNDGLNLHTLVLRYRL